MALSRPMHVRLVALACLLACRAPTTTTAIRPEQTVVPLRARPQDPTTATLAGRVRRDGKPMKQFVVAVGKQRHVVRHHRGQFEIADLEPGTADITIAGPGFAHRKYLERELRAGGILDLGDIAVEHGSTIEGHVHDAAGQAVAGATVAIEHAFVHEVDVSGRWLDGHQTTTTDARGVYRFTDVSARGGYIVAWRDGLISEKRTLPGCDAVMDLVVVSSGAIDATSEVAGGWVTVWPNRRATRQQGVEPVDGVYHFDRLVPDTYTVRLFAPAGFAAPRPQRVVVVAGQRASVTLRAPAISVQVTIATRVPCAGLVLQRMDWEVASLGCETGDAEIDGVPPGRYEACDSWGCKTIDVLPAPAHQTFDLRTP